MIVEVTQEDINKGKRGNPCACPVARALKRAGFPCPSVGTRDFYPDSDAPYPQVAPLPSKATEFILGFDRGTQVKPFRFRVKKPS